MNIGFVGRDAYQQDLSVQTMSEDDRLIYQLSRAHYRLSSYLQKALVAKNVKITQAQAAILFLLEKSPLTMTEISQHLEIDNSAITSVVDRLETAFFAKRTVNPKDRRTFLIAITPRGQDEIDKARPIIRKVNLEIKAGFSVEEVDAFKRVLNSLYSKLNHRNRIDEKAIS